MRGDVGAKLLVLMRIRQNTINRNRSHRVENFPPRSRPESVEGKAIYITQRRAAKTNANDIEIFMSKQQKMSVGTDDLMG